MLRTYKGSPHPFPIALGALIPKRRPDAGSPAPELSLRVDELRLESEKLEAYQAFCGFPSSSRAPLPYLFVLSFGAQAALLVQRSFPLSALGMVHTHCRLESFEPIESGATLSLELEVTGWRQVRKGREVDVECRYLVAGREVARGLQTSLSLGGGTGEARSVSRREGPPETPYEEWTLTADTGRRYAKISGDYNPIHLWPLTSRPLGFNRPIAHGMYLVSRAVAEIESRESIIARRLDVSFKTPARLPGNIRFFSHQDSGQSSFELWNGRGERPHVKGALAPDPS